MDNLKSTFTVFFEEPFWVGIYRREYQNHYEVSKVTFGAEPKNQEIYNFIITNWQNLRFSPALIFEDFEVQHPNPKRQQRAIRDQLKGKSIGTKSQQALKLQHEESKVQRKKNSRQEKIEKKEFQFALNQKKRKAKHKGH
ncbi:MAG: YjdF family protein [Clostridiales bacterium]